MARPRKSQKAVLADYRDGKPGRIYRAWKASYDGFRLNLGVKDAAARGKATRRVAAQFDLTERQIQNITSKGELLERALKATGRLGAAKSEKQRRAFLDTLMPIYDAIELLRKPRYEDLLERCAMAAHTKLPEALREFTSAPAATAPDSLQYLAGMLAQAFLRAHGIAEREVPAYSEMKMPLRR